MFDIGAAIVGTGFMGPTHTEALRRLGIRVVGVLGSSAEKSQRFAQEYGIPKAYGSYQELLADPDVQSVHITAPNRWHYTMARQALEAGKHVMCEKPLTMTSAESAALVALARQVRLAAGVNYNYRFYPISLEARARVQAGQLGEIISVVGGYVQDWLLYPTDYNWRLLVSEGGPLRAVADIGTHWMDLVQFITGVRIASVYADLHTVYPVRRRPRGEVATFTGPLDQEEATEAIEIETEDLGGVLLRFENGARGLLWVSQMTPGRKNRLYYEIAGKKAALAFNGERPNELWLGHRDRPNEQLLKDPSLLDAQVLPYTDYPGGHNEGYPDSFKMCFRAFYSYIAQGDFQAPPPFPTFEEGHHEIRLCEAILRSHREQRWISLA